MRSDGLILFSPKRTSAMKPHLPALLCALACLPAFAAPQEQTASAECRAVMRDAVLLKSAETFCFKETMAATGGLGKLADIYKRLDAPMKACEKKYGRPSPQSVIVRSIPGLADLLGMVWTADLNAPTAPLHAKAETYCAAQNAEIVRVVGKYK